MTAEQRRLQPRKQPRQARAEQTRQRILDAAAHVFAEHGYAAGTTNRIAERARISIGSLYQYYPNKDAILSELMDRHLEAGDAAYRAARDAGLPDTFEGAVRLLVRIVIENHSDDPRLLRVMVEQPPRSPELLAKVAERERERIAFMEGLLAGYPEVRVADPYTAARLTISTCELLVHQLIASPVPVDPELLEQELVTMLTRYATG